MLRLRPYINCDAQYIAAWIKDERSLRKWSADRYGAFPVTADDINRKYTEHNGDCAEPDNFYPMTAFDEDGVVGHLIMRFTDQKKSILRFGFVIVDDQKRGRGYGKEMLNLSIKYAFDILKADKITIGVFENNPSAYFCYRSVGFLDLQNDEPVYYSVMGEQWKCLEMELIK